MHVILRIVLALVAFVAVHFFSYWMVFAQVFPMELAFVPALLLGAGVGWYVWRQSAGMSGRGFVGHIVFGALIVGTIGFIGGFFGPIVFAPEANQGPLLGLFITGPAGFIIGGIAGAIWWFVRKNQKTDVK